MKTHSNHPNRPAPAAPPASSPLRYAAVRRLGLFMAALMFLWSVAPAWAQIAITTGGTLAGDTITFANPTTSPIIDYSSFSISSGQNITIDDANVLNGRSLHRISGETSLINGGLKADNIIYLVNPNGIIFGGNARVDVGGLVASALHIDEAEFLTGNPLKFLYHSGMGNIVVSNGAQIAAAGIAYFLGQSVDIQGSVRAGDIFVGAYGGKYETILELETAGGASITLDLSAMGSNIALEGDGTVDISNASIEGTNTTGTLGAWAAAGLVQTNGVVTNMAAIQMQSVEDMLVSALYASAAPDASITLETTVGSLHLTNNSIISASGGITMNSASNLVMRTNTALSAGGGITLNSTNRMTLRTVTSANGDVKATNEGIDLFSDVTAQAGSIDLQSSITLTMLSGSSLSAGSNITLTSGSMVLRTVTSTHGDVKVVSDRGMSLSSNVTAQAGSIDLDSGRELYMDSGSSLWASNAVRLNSASNMTLRDVTALTGNVAATNQSGEMRIYNTMTAGGGINLHAVSNDLLMQAGSSLSADGNVTLTIGGGMTLYGVTSTNGDVKVTSGGYMDLNSNVTAQAGSIDLQSGGQLTMREGSSLSAESNVVLNTASGNTSLRGITATNGGIFVTNQSGTLTLRSNITAGADASFTALGGELVVTNAGTTVSAGGNLSMTTASNLMMRTDTALSAGADITLNSGDMMYLYAVTTTNGDMKATSGSDMSLYSDVTAQAGSIDLDSGGMLTMVTGSSLSANSNVTLNSTNYMYLRNVTSTNGDVKAMGDQMALHSNVTAQVGSIELDSGNVLEMNLGSLLWASNAITLNSGDVMTLRDVTTLTGNVAATNQSGDMFIRRDITAGGEINLHTVSDNLSMQSGSSLSANSNVVLNSGGGMNLYGITSTNGDVRAVSGASINLYSNVTAQAGSIDLQAGNLLQMINSDASLSAAGTLTVEGAAGIGMRQTNSVSAGDVAFRSTSGDIWLNGTTLTSGNNLALETTGDIIVSNNAALSAGGDVFVSAGGDLTAKLSAGGGYYAEAGGTETLDATGTRMDGMQLTFDRLAADGTPDPMVFTGGVWPPPVPPQPMPDPVPPQPSKPKPQPQPEPDPVAPSVMNLQIQRAMAEIPQSQDLVSLRDGVVDEDHLFFLDGTRPHPGPQTGKTVQYLKLQEGAITQE